MKIIIAIIIILLIILVFSVCRENYEPWTSNTYELPKIPLLINEITFRGQNFKTIDYINNLRRNNTIQENKTNYIKKDGKFYRDLTKSKNLPNIFIIPGIGASPIYKNGNKIWPGNGSSPLNYSDTYVPDHSFFDFEGQDYFYKMVDALQAVGYKKGENLFSICYDSFRIGTFSEINNFCYILKNLIESKYNKEKCIIISHDLGCVITNYFLNFYSNNFKDQYINKVYYIQGTFGGCPKALRTILERKEYSKMTGMYMMLPDKNYYYDHPLVEYNQIVYFGKDINEILKNIVDPKLFEESMRIYEFAMAVPNVEIHVLCSNDTNTECSYKLDQSKMNIMINQQKIFKGDGTMPLFCLEIPILFSKEQRKSVYFKFFEDSDHNLILSNYYLIKYIIDRLF